ncbi:BAH_G0004440.mRNA.1.CDS.1 [Saccharomyces cerevisiae]|nr:SX2_G0016610.mRNA.1.CDS.1 [Saccharomyces cerevisiae]CAI4277694.1 BAG_1a_G0004440.mRNA.1.CDS.1 [Saccharomyces cerevisiae]CAI4280710.1 BAH_G0004440.mRNA.1.CDS.1 [Saccharomyces cerevisiae]CAI7050539.1 BAG_1a_G0004440.mRNA.1.CDS.1 [Saccharomyces cerevisiae]CAI7050671.1 BAH_G0004440.mRNA.1.CDS.1 [Saccharomyces cerevisiae]
MDRTQTFIKECLFTKCLEDPEKPFNENRFQDTLLLLPTDGGLTSRLQRQQRKSKLNLDNLQKTSQLESADKQLGKRYYQRINKNSKIALREYINNCKKNTKKCLKLAYENKITDKEDLLHYIEEKHLTIYESLPQYVDFVPMYKELWINYIKELLNITKNLKTFNGSLALLKLSMADYNGALLRVTKSKNKTLIGLQGIVIWDSQKFFIMIVKGNIIDEIKCIPKKGTVFQFEIPISDDDDSALRYSILGDRFKYRSVDRAGRKFKSRRCDDMLYYIQN